MKQFSISENQDGNSSFEDEYAHLSVKLDSLDVEYTIESLVYSAGMVTALIFNLLLIL